MKVSKRGEYGMRALCYLAAHHDEAIPTLFDDRTRVSPNSNETSIDSS